ncbi:MAG: anti-sigma factor antagonist [Rhodocyclaceae bacterium]|nr:anti-sigma factor antagonist [Rhodocyclaceae bacterium]
MVSQVNSRRAGNTLSVTVNGAFDFEAAREFMLLCKASITDGVQEITLNMEAVDGVNSSAVGAMIVVSELAGSGHFHIRLQRCPEQVNQLFMSGVLDNYLDRKVVVERQG